MSEAPKNPPSAISQHLREELIRILQVGDERNDGAFTIAIATMVEKFAVAAREILMTENLAKQDLGSLMRLRRQPPFGAYVGGGLYGSYGSMSIGDQSEILPGVNNENFGVQAIRQIVDAAKGMHDSPAKLVEALAVAKENKLDDVAAVLEAKLGVVKPVAPVAEEAVS
jgi:hypothetical protein